jgi:hypothetical protein
MYETLRSKKYDVRNSKTKPKIEKIKNWNSFRTILKQSLKCHQNLLKKMAIGLNGLNNLFEFLQKKLLSSQAVRIRVMPDTLNKLFVIV